MSGNLYQLYSLRKLPVGTPFTVNGPYDMFGYVLKFIKEKKFGNQINYLHLIRGTGNNER